MHGMKNYDVLVIGAGPAGLMAAGRAAEKGARVLVLEKMRLPGRKLLITGKGRCNITNVAPVEEFISHIFPEGRFLRNAFSKFYSDDIIRLLKKYGVEVTLERGGRYFPASNKSKDVLDALLRWVSEQKVEIRGGSRVEDLLLENGAVKGLVVNGQELFCDQVILATGGKSYPATGSDGDGYRLAQRAGHSLVEPMPSLVPLVCKGNTAEKLQGLALKNVRAILWENGKKTAEEFGEMLFTHFGLSGPIILTLSRRAVAALHQHRRVEVTVDLKPALEDQKLDKRLIRDLNEQGKKKLGNLFKNWLPASMIPVFIELLELDPEKEGHQVSASERKKIRHLMKNLKFEVTGHRAFKEAIITAGGIPTREVRPGTMESKKVSGLYFAGEILDLDADTGGYNLQIAYSTGWLAGDSSFTNPQGML